jgi:hypothetical protein
MKGRRRNDKKRSHENRKEKTDGQQDKYVLAGNSISEIMNPFMLVIGCHISY